ncbi:MAG: hypothetical protein PHC70_03440 [Patescibacteria group bacterium]|nr:hypothetical protein [Patescibacteria group bacterium]
MLYTHYTPILLFPHFCHPCESEDPEKLVFKKPPRCHVSRETDFVFILFFFPLFPQKWSTAPAKAALGAAGGKLLGLRIRFFLRGYSFHVGRSTPQPQTPRDIKGLFINLKKFDLK